MNDLDDVRFCNDGYNKDIKRNEKELNFKPAGNRNMPYSLYYDSVNAEKIENIVIQNFIMKEFIEYIENKYRKTVRDMIEESVKVNGTANIGGDLSFYDDAVGVHPIVHVVKHRCGKTAHEPLR